MSNNKINVKDLIQQMREEVISENGGKRFKNLLDYSKKEAKKKEVKVIKPLFKTLRIKRKVVLVRGNDAKKVKKRGRK